MEAFFKRVLQSVILTILTGKGDATPEEAQAAIKGYIGEAVHDGMAEFQEIINGIPTQIDQLEKNALSNIDAMDGKVGNLQEQLTAIPGEIVKDTVDGVLGGFDAILKKFNPFRLPGQ